MTQTNTHQATNLTDQFLIAMPRLADPDFHKSVTYICEHSPDGALGIMINRTLNLSVKQMLEEIDIEVSNEQLAEQAVCIGGPVHPNRGFILHSPNTEWESTLHINDTISLTTSRDILQAIAAGTGPTKTLIALGYAGWGEGQLEQEILSNSWLNADADYEILFSTPTELRWLKAAEKIGIDLNCLSDDAGHA